MDLPHPFNPYLKEEMTPTDAAQTIKIKCKHRGLQNANWLHFRFWSTEQESVLSNIFEIQASRPPNMRNFINMINIIKSRKLKKILKL